MGEAQVIQLFEIKELTCCLCKKSKPAAEFNKNSTKKRGYSYRCRECINNAQRKPWGRYPLSKENRKKNSVRTSARLAKNREPILALLKNYNLLKCTKCEITKDASNFRVDKHRYTGHFARCKSCITKIYSEKQKEYYQKNKNKICIKAKWYRHKYELSFSQEDYYRMLSSQNGCCAICKSSVKNINRKFFEIDHNHKTGKVRGLLCALCNKGLGMFRDNITAIKNAASYLEERGSYGS